MITLCGFAVSNYFNIVKQVLLEKQIPFTEERTMTRSKDEAVLSASPLGKVPFTSITIALPGFKSPEINAQPSSM